MNVHIQIREVLGLDTFKQSKVLAGKQNLDKSVRCVYLAETFPNVRDIFEWLSGQELLVVIGYGIQNGDYTFLELVELAHEKGVAGLAIYIGDYIQDIPEAVIEKCNVYDLPLLTLPWSVKYVDINQDLTRAIMQLESKQKTSFDLLDSLLFSDLVSSEKLIKRGQAFEIDLTQKHRISIVDIDGFNEYISDHAIEDEYDILRLKNVLYDVVRTEFAHRGLNTVHMLKSDSVISLISENSYKKLDMKVLNRSISNALSSYYQNLTVSMGIGSAYDDLSDLRTSYREAEQVLKLKLTGLVEEYVYIYEELHFYKVLCEMEGGHKIKKKFPYLLTPIIQYDKVHNAELISTLECYLDTGRSLSETAEKLFVHRNTVKYRIDKIKNITGLDIGQMEVRFNLMFEIRLCRYYGLL